MMEGPLPLWLHMARAFGRGTKSGQYNNYCDDAAAAAAAAATE